MKKRKWIYLLLIMLCVAVFWMYYAVDMMYTDRRAPKIQFSETMLELSVLDPEEVLLQGVTASDHTDGDVTASVVVESIRLLSPDGTLNVSYAAFDKAGNVVKAERQARYTDYESPEFHLEEPLIFTQNRSVDLLEFIRAEDKLDGDISRRLKVNAMADSVTGEVGSYEILCRVTNSLADTAELTLPVEVLPAGKYNASLELSDYLIYLPQGASFKPEQFLTKFSYNAITLSLNGGSSGAVSVQTTGQVDTQVPGVYEVTYTAIHTVGNQTYTGYSRLVVVVEE